MVSVKPRDARPPFGDLNRETSKGGERPGSFALFHRTWHCSLMVRMKRSGHAVALGLTDESGVVLDAEPG
jgi:hypothetical protein